MSIQEQYILVKKANGDVGITQNSVEVFKSTNASALANTLILKEGMVGIGLVAPTTKLHVQVANTINKQALLIEQLDTTNNPICAEINNDGTNYGLYIHQDGVLAANKYGLYLYSNAVQINSYFALIEQANASSTANVLVVANASIGTCVQVYQSGVLKAGGIGLYAYSNAAQVNANSYLFFVNQSNASSITEAAAIWNAGTGAALYINQVGNGIAQEINNDGTNHGLYIHQDGVLASSRYGVYIYTTVAQINSPLIHIEAASNSQTTQVIRIVNRTLGAGLYILSTLAGSGNCLELDNDGTNHGLYVSQDGVLAASKYGLYVYSNTAQTTTDYLVKFYSQEGGASNSAGVLYVHSNTKGIALNVLSEAGAGDAIKITTNSTTGRGIFIDNNSTNHGVYIQQDGVLATGKRALYVYSGANQSNAGSPLVLFSQEHASSTQQALLIAQYGTGTCAEIDSNGAGNGLYIHQDGVLAASNYGLYVYSNAIQVNDYLTYFYSANASSNKFTSYIGNNGTGGALFIEQGSTGTCAEINNDGTGYGIYLHQDNAGLSTAFYLSNAGTGTSIFISQTGVLASGEYGLRIYSNAIQNQNAQLLVVQMTNASSSSSVMQMNNAGTGRSLIISQDGVLAAGLHAVAIVSNAIQTQSACSLLHLWQDNAASNLSGGTVLTIKNDGIGRGIYIEQNGNGPSIEIYNSGTNNGCYIQQDGVLAASKYGLYVYSNAVQVYASYQGLARFQMDNASASMDVVDIWNDGTGIGLRIAQIGNGQVLNLYSEGTSDMLILTEAANLASGKYMLYLDNNGTPADGAGRCIRLDGCTISSTKNPETDAEVGFIAVNIDGTQRAIPYYALS